MTDTRPLSAIDDDSMADRTIPKIPGDNGPTAAADETAVEHTLSPGTRLEEFEITGVIGQGGFGIVYLAYDHSLGRRVALKEYMPAAFATRRNDGVVTVRPARHLDTFKAGLRSFVNEAHLLAQFEHPSLVRVHRFWEANGTAYMAMPFYEAPNLKKTIERLGAAPDEAWLKMFLVQILGALEVLHAKRCFHRDIAPDNILMLEGNRPLLLDFGAARQFIDDKTQALTVILKPSYAPIEQYADAPSMTQGPWTDLYGLASVVYAAVTGNPPLQAVKRLLSDQLTPLSECAAGRYSDRFLRAIDAALAVKPEDRPQSVAEFRTLLGLEAPAATGPMIQTSVPHAATRMPPRQLQPWPPNRPVLYALCSLAMTALLGGAAYVFDGQARPASTHPLSAAPAPIQPNPLAISNVPAPKEPPAMSPNNATQPVHDEPAQQDEQTTWKQWQTQMQEAFARTEASAGTAESKISAWDRFLAAYAKDNPFSDEDQALRRMAAERKSAAQERLAQPQPKNETASPLSVHETAHETTRPDKDANVKDKNPESMSTRTGNDRAQQRNRMAVQATGNRCPDLYTKVSLGVESLSSDDRRYFSENCR